MICENKISGVDRLGRGEREREKLEFKEDTKKNLFLTKKKKYTSNTNCEFKLP